MAGKLTADVEVRTSARVILIDPTDRVLLLAARNTADDKIVWFSARRRRGGGGEPRAAAVRELAEEVPMAGSVSCEAPSGPATTISVGPGSPSA